VIHRLSSRLSGNASLLPVAVVAWTPALAIIAGWAWAEWAMLGFVLLSLLRWHDFLDSRNASDLAISAAALGAALASKYTALPWLAIFVPLAVWRLRSWRPIVAAAVIVTAIGGLFYVRNLLWTGSPIAPFLLANSPTVTQYRSSAGGWSELIHGYDILHKDIIDDSLGILLPVMVLLSPLALLARTRPVADTFLLGLGQMLILVPLAPTSRLIALALVPLAILGASAAASTWSRKWLFVPVALALYAQLLLIAYVFVTSQDFLRYVVGAETEATNLQRTRDYVGAYRWIAEHTAEDAKLLLLAENRTFHLERRAMAAGNLDGPRVAAWLAQFPSADAMRDGIAREGVTHIVVHTPWYRIDLPGTPPPHMLEKEYLLVVAPHTHMVLRQYLAAHARIVYKDAAFVVYAI
ncbi:MAG TPA: hypothetical protein VMU84_22040, partial [Thermoanaerobaculia bacterium]|nr:hypothetical protein [Thermoanaerobaculia bacterium]